MLRVTTSVRKGGTGKSTLVSNLAGLYARAGHRVVVVDLDPQGDLGTDLGYADSEGDDAGKGMFEAAYFGRPLTPIPNVRPNLDAVPGGRHLEALVRMEDIFRQEGRVPELVVSDALDTLDSSYDLVLIDTPPGARFLHDAALASARFVLAPTRSDANSLKGISRLGESFQRVREVNTSLELLGVVLFGINPSATALERDLRAEVSQRLGGVAPCFASTIRFMERAAVDARRAGLLMHEYVEQVVDARRSWYDGKERSGTKPAVSMTAHRLAEDFARLAEEVLAQMRVRLGSDVLPSGTPVVRPAADPQQLDLTGAGKDDNETAGAAAGKVK